MCSTCGCASDEVYIEGDEHGHAHHHEDERHHSPHHCHEHSCAHGGQQRTVIIHHHYYHHQGDVHHHHNTYYAVENEIETKSEAQKKVKNQRDLLTEDEEQTLDYGNGTAGVHAPGINQKRMLQIEMDVLSKNNHIAEHNREHFSRQNILALNLVSSPGSGKTTLLTETLLRLKQRRPCAVVEGDQQTNHDAERIRATGVSAIQVNTGKGCHLDAQMIHDATHRLTLENESILFIENVGNLVCPAGFDLGEKHKVALLSVTEGEDKPLKYPHMFSAASIMLINKIDLLPYLSFDIDACIANARKVNPNITVIPISATSGAGMDEWLAWINAQ